MLKYIVIGPIIFIHTVFNSPNGLLLEIIKFLDSIGYIEYISFAVSFYLSHFVHFQRLVYEFIGWGKCHSLLIIHM